MEIILREMCADDWPDVREIYRQGIAGGNATFETEVPPFEKWDAAHVKTCRLIAVLDGDIAGWAALSPVSARPAYRGVAEVSIYIAERHRGVGVGGRLLRELIKEAEKHGFWTLQSSTFPENAASRMLQERYGFRVVGLRRKIARDADGAWRDTLLMERRSDVAGL